MRRCDDGTGKKGQQNKRRERLSNSPVERPEGVIEIEDDQARKDLKEAQDLQRLLLHPLVPHPSPLLALPPTTTRQKTT